MQIGQNLIAPGISLPQQGQLRWCWLLMDLTAKLGQAVQMIKETPISVTGLPCGSHSTGSAN
jgi:hypothetical protein